jgi:hypothetical protein
VVQGWWHSSEDSTFAKAVFSSYPLGDIASLFGALVLYRGISTNSTMRRATACLATGLVLLAFADTTFSYYNLIGAYQTGSWFDWGWSFGWLMIAWAPLIALWWSGKHNEVVETEFVQTVATRNIWRMLEPYAAVAAAISVVAIQDYQKSTDGRISLTVYLAGSALILLVISRQVLTLVDNQHLTTQLRAFATNLEQTVAQRRSN